MIPDYHRRLSIRIQMLLLIAAIAIPIIAVVVWFVSNEIRDERADAFDRIKHANAIVASRIGQILTDHEVLLRLAATEYRGSTPTKTPGFNAEQFLRMHPQIINIGVRDLAANNIHSYRGSPKPPEEALKFPWVQRGITSDSFEVGDAFLGNLTGRWVSVMTHPVTDNTGKRTGFISLSIDLLTLNERIKIGLPSGFLLTVMDSEFNFLMRSENPEEWIGKPLKPELANLYRGNNAGFLKAPNVAGIPYLWSFTKVPGSNWVVSVGVPEDVALAPVQAIITKTIVIGMLLLVIMVAVAQILADLISRPILKLAEAAFQISKGNRTFRAVDSGPAEVSSVIGQFNSMLDSLEQQRSARDALAGHYATLIKAARDIILLLDDQGRIVEGNDAALQAYGYTIDELRNLTIRDLRTPESQLAINTDWHKAAQQKGVLFEAEHRRRDGSTFPVEVSSRALEIDGKLFRQSFVRDISERRSRESDLKKQLAELRRWQHAMLDREGRIAELKQEINKLLIEAGQAPRYSRDHLTDGKPADE